MYLVREIMHCEPGKVRPMVDRFLTMAKIMERSGQGKVRVLTDLAGERYWTIVAEMETESLDSFLSMEMDPELEAEMGKVMDGYHDLVQQGRREIFRIEGARAGGS